MKHITSTMPGLRIEITDRSDDVLKALKNAIERGLEGIGMSAQEHATQIITAAGAVDTGRLKNSITFALAGKSANAATYKDDNGKMFSYSGTAPGKGDTVYIGTNVEYAQGIETGTHRKSGGVHFLSRAASDYRTEYRDIIKDSLENA